MSVILSHGGATIFKSSSPSNEVWIGTQQGVVLLKRDSANAEWKVAHQALTDKHIHAIILEPVSGTMFAGATKDSIYASEDGGYTWELRDKGLTQTDIYSLNSIQLESGVRVLAGTEPAHLFYSDDLGHNWTEMEALRSVDTSDWFFPGPPHVAHTKNINFHPNDPNTLFIGIEVGGLQKSTDAGKTFTRIYGMDNDVHRTVINPQKPDHMYVTSGDGGRLFVIDTELRNVASSFFRHHPTTFRVVGVANMTGFLHYFEAFAEVLLVDFFFTCRVSCKNLYVAEPF